MKALLERRSKRLKRTVQEHLPIGGRMLVKHSQEQDRHLNRQLAGSLAFVAGALNAGGFLAVGVYTSHVTGNLSRAVDDVALGLIAPALGALSLVGSFFLGAFCSGLLVSLGQRRRFKGRYAFSLLVQALLLAVFAWFGSTVDLGDKALVPYIACMLSFLMGMHNSVVTTVSNAEVRTTHMTGVVTDLGIELSRLLYMNRSVRNRSVLFVFAGLFAVLLLLLAIRPVLTDIQSRWRLGRRQRNA